MGIHKLPTRRQVFSGWKEIANYLGKGVRTVQRYEREVGLPIHRIAGKTQGSVISTKAELDDWVSAGPMRPEAVPKKWPTKQTNKIGAEFLLIDSHIALTFSGIALEAPEGEKRARTSTTARRAYDTILRLRKGIELNDSQIATLNANLLRLENELRSLGVMAPV
jgi:hypothetical protein